MAQFFDEKWDSRGVTMGPSVNDADRKYLFVGTNDTTFMEATLLANTPTAVQTARGEAVRQQIRLRNVGPDLWEGTVDYGLADEPDSRKAPETGDVEISFDTTGGTAHVTTSLETVGTYPIAGYVAPDHKGLINVTSAGVEGTDIVASSLKMNLVGYLPDAVAGQPAYWRNAKALTGQMNDAAFYGFDRGEVQFLGQTGQQRGRGDWKVQAGFKIEGNVQNLVVANGEITVTTKLGHDYIWFLCKRVEDATAGALAMRPKAAYVERILYFKDFTTLGFGAQRP